MSKKAYDKWYAEHGAEHNRARKAKYHDDPEVREKAKENARRWRREGSKPFERGGVTYYALAAAALAVGTSSNTLKQWMERGYYPQPAINGNRWEFTAHQVMLLKPLAEYVKTHHYREPGYQDKIAGLCQKIHDGWSA